MQNSARLPAQITLTHWKEKKAILVEILLTWKLFFMDIEKVFIYAAIPQPTKTSSLKRLENS